MSRTRHPWVLLVGLLALAAGFVPVPAAAASSASPFEPAPLPGRIAPVTMPVGIAGGRAVQVVVKLAGDPVAVEQARAGTKLATSRKQAIKDDLRRKQSSVEGALSAHGASVLARFQSAVNGIRVSVPASRVGELASVPGVVAVMPLAEVTPDNAVSVPLIGAPAVWDGAAGFRGEGRKVAIIDTGIDYTHANFGGPGTVAAFQQAAAASTQPADPALFGPTAVKVKGGIDLVGDDYDASSTDPAHTVPHPDPNPLDCNGHGSHVAGTAAGFGVRSDGTTFTGPYDASTHATNTFRIGPGVAPLADLYAVRVFGCVGSTNGVVDALDWAVDNDMDVVNMSLGSPFGRPDDATAEASDNAASAGVVVVASAGNSGASPYITGSPAAGTRAISVAASDATAGFPGASVALSTGPRFTALNANGARFADGASFPITVLRNAAGGVSLGCSESEYGNVAGKLVVTLRGVCARVDRAVFGARHGAAAVVMINNTAGLPPFEGDIVDPVSGATVTIPFLGVRGVLGTPATDEGDNLVAADGQTLTAANITFANPAFKAFAGFSSGGPRMADSFLKPDITAPGVSTLSTASGTGNLGTRLSGTSMASPHVAGVAALTVQAHPTWSVEDVKAAIVNTGKASEVAGYTTSRGGTGLVQAPGAARTSVDAVGDPGTATLNFGFSELSVDAVRTKQISVRNHGTAPVTFTVSAAATPGSAPHTTNLNGQTITVPAGGSRTVTLLLRVPAASVGDSTAFHEVAGLVTLTPKSGQNADVALSVPYYLVPRALSQVVTAPLGRLSASQPAVQALVLNPAGAIAGAADFYTWGLQDGDDNLVANDVRAVGVKGVDDPTLGRLVVFAVSTQRRWSNAAVSEYDVLLDTNGDGVDDHAVVGADFGNVTAGSFDGRMGAFVFDLATGAASIFFFATAPTDSSTLLLPVPASALGLSAANPRFTYGAAAFSTEGLGDDPVEGRAAFNAFTPALSASPDAVTVARNDHTTVDLSLNAAEAQQTPFLGFMVVSFDNASGAREAQLIPVSGS
jgi:minor extracellular serine protease Vpr